MKTKAKYSWRDSTRFIPLFGLLRKKNLTLPFLDVLVEKCSSKFITFIYRKPTFTGQYIRWNSFGPQKRKTNLIRTLTYRALAICSPERCNRNWTKLNLFFWIIDTQNIVSTRIWQRRVNNFTTHRNSVQKNARSIYIFPGSVCFQTDLKNN